MRLGIEQKQFRALDVDLTARALQAMVQGLTMAAFSTPSESTPRQRHAEVDELLMLIRCGIGC